MTTEDTYLYSAGPHHRGRVSPRWRRAARAVASAGLFAGAVLVAASAAVADESEAEAAAEEVDYLGLAARMVHDRHFDRALAVLAEVTPDDPKVDAKRYFTLRGLAHLEQKELKSARSDFQDAIKAGQTDPHVYVYLGQAQFGLKAYADVLVALSKAASVGDGEPAVFLMRAESHWNLKHYAAAIDVLRAGARRFPTQADFERLQIFHLIELGLYLEATSVSEKYLGRPEIKEDDYVAVGEAMRAAGEYVKAQLLLEEAKLRFPASEKVMVQLAHAYLDAGRPQSAAMLFEDAARLNEKYTLEAAELYKRARQSYRALTLNSRVMDQTAKMKQRLSLLLSAEDFELVAAMQPKLSRLGLLKDDNVRYALAYALFKTRRFPEAEAQLKLISEPELFESSLQLRKAMQTCDAAGWECSL